MYSDTTARQLGLTTAQQEQMQDWDRRYKQEYDRLGSDGIEQKDLGSLNSRRESELRTILSPEQFEQWNVMDNNRNDRRTLTTGGAPGPEMRAIPQQEQPDILDERSRSRNIEMDKRNTVPAQTGDQPVGPDGTTGTSGTGSATDGGNRNTVTPPTP